MGEAESLPRRPFTIENIFREFVLAASSTGWNLDVISFCTPNCLSAVIMWLFVQLPVYFQASLSPTSFSTTSGSLGIMDGRVVPSRGISVWNTLYSLRGIFVKEDRWGAVVEDSHLFHIFGGVGGGRDLGSDLARSQHKDVLSIPFMFLELMSFQDSLGLDMFVSTLARMWSDICRSDTCRSSTVMDLTRFEWTDLESTQSRICPCQCVGWETCWQISKESESCMSSFGLCPGDCQSGSWNLPVRQYHQIIILWCADS